MSRYGLIGEKLGHSYSAVIHTKFYEKRNLDETYDLIEIPKHSLKAEFERIAQSYRGINVTIPYKLDVMEFLDYISPEAKAIGAVNTVKFGKERIEGHNTDYFGLKCTFDVNNIEIKGKRVVILGTGGVSRAALAVCRDMGASDITFVSTSSPKIGGYRVITYDDIIEGDILINCTPVGMYPKADASPLNDISDTFSAVVDTIYNPSCTKLMKTAAQKGIKAISGLYMLVSQAMFSQAIWKDEEIDTDIIDTIYKEMNEQ